jgi:hypothetical protein
MLVATVYLRSTSGRSLLREGVPSGDITPFLPARATLDRAAAELERRGFIIEGRGVTLSISGSEDTFSRELGGLSGTPTVPAGLEALIDGILVQSPGVPF